MFNRRLEAGFCFDWKCWDEVPFSGLDFGNHLPLDQTPRLENVITFVDTIAGTILCCSVATKRI